MMKRTLYALMAASALLALTTEAKSLYDAYKDV